MGRPRITLNMIVKNEAPVIARCLASVRPWIDHWVIVDTGSDDGTQNAVRAALEGVPGSLHERPWRDFAHNRNEALALAQGKGDYILFIDADETLRMPPNFGWPALDGTGYYFVCEYDHLRYQRNALISADLPWRWCGVLHEYLDCAEPHRWQTLDGPAIVVSHDGARARDPQTYQRDAEILEAACESDPSNSRNVFYLAQSLRDAGKLVPSRARYIQRAGMGGWEEERWCAQLRAAQLAELIGCSIAEIRSGYLSAHQARPSRPEPLYELARYHRLRGEFALAYLFAQQAVALVPSADTLFIDASIGAWRALDELAIAAFYAGRPGPGRTACAQLLASPAVPESERLRIVANAAFFGM